MTKHNDETKKGQAQAAVEAALVVLRNKEAEANVELAAEKQKADAEKKRADAVLFETSGAEGLVCRCHIPTAVVAQRGLFRILLGDTVTEVMTKGVPVLVEPTVMVNEMGSVP